MATEEKSHQLVNVKTMPPNQADREIPTPPNLVCYMKDVNNVKEADIVGWKMIPDYDVFKLILRDGTVFEITGPLLAAYENATGID